MSWPKAIAGAGRACLHCSSCTALTPLIGLRMNHIFSPFPPVPHVTWSPRAQAGRWKPKTLLFAVMVLHGLNWPVKLQCSSLWALAEQLFCPPALLCVCLHRPTSISSSPCCFQERPLLLDIFPCCLWISPSLVCFVEMLWALLHLTLSFKVSPPAFGN